MDVVLVYRISTKDGDKGMGNPPEMDGTLTTHPGNSLATFLSFFWKGPAEGLNLT